MFYVISNTYTGNSSTMHDADCIEITTAAARDNQTGGEISSGWCGNTNDWSVTAHGAYQTIEEARAAITDIFGDVRAADTEDTNCSADAVQVFRPGKYEPMTLEHSQMWSYESVCHDITASTTDDQINQLFAEYEKLASEEISMSLHPDLIHDMRTHRDGLAD